MKKKWLISIGAIFIIVSLVFVISNKNNSSIALNQGSIKKNSSNMVAINVSEDGINYTSQKDIPIGDYTLSTEKSKCRIPTTTLNGENAPVDESVTIEYTDGKLNFLGLTKNDTKCYVYLDKKSLAPSEETLAKLNITTIKEGTPDFSTIATGAETEDNNGIYKVEDGMYSGYSYYWRGAATTNHVIFDSKCWRIVRINGDGSIRLIYNGTPTNDVCPGNGNSSAVIMGSSNAEKYYATSDGEYDNPSYVGWAYVLNAQRVTSGTPSNAKTQTENWYNSNISAAEKTKVDTAGKFCGDRNVGNPPASWSWSDYVISWSAWLDSTSKRFTYTTAERVIDVYTPTLVCEPGDVYTLSAGAITADEVMLAGGKQESNNSYYLYTGQNYWTMSPARWNGSVAQEFFVQNNGYLNITPVSNYNSGLLPVINLKADTLFNIGSDGTQNNPYIVQ